MRVVLLVLALAAGLSQTASFAQDCSVHKQCPQMRSCAEADFYLRQCGDQARDANHNGIPCEDICGDTMEIYLQRRVSSDIEGFRLSSPTVACGSKRTCGQMVSCEEAKAYLNQCGVTRLDGNGDGVPCESLCR